MDAALQGKVNLLGALFLAFTLLAVPLFSQVKADTRESVKQAPDTLLSQWARGVSQELMPDKPVQVEDAWGEQAKEQNPNCGVECDPDGDLDGDGVSNKEELERGTNPACNEKEYGEEFCRQQDDKFNVTTPDDENNTVPFRKMLLNETWSTNQGFETYPFTTENLTYDRFLIYINETRGATGWSLILEHDGSEDPVWADEGSDNDPFMTGQEEMDPREEVVVEPPPGEYMAEFTTDGFFPALSPSEVELIIYGVVN